MTTIAYKDGMIAYDGRMTQGDVITTDTYQKMWERDGVKFFLTGKRVDYGALINGWFGLPRPDTCPECSAFVVDTDGTVWEIGCNEENIFWKDEIDRDTPCACGSGMPFALAAMDMGASAEKAVRVAAGRDVYTGGTIRTFRVS